MNNFKTRTNNQVDTDVRELTAENDREKYNGKNDNDSDKGEGGRRRRRKTTMKWLCQSVN